MVLISLNANNTGSIVRAIQSSQNETLSSIEKLSSGKRINSAGDDAASISINAKLESKIRSITKTTMNLSDAISFVDTMEQMIGEVSDSVQKLREITVKAKNGTNGQDELSILQTEFNSYVDNIDKLGQNGMFPLFSFQQPFSPGRDLIVQSGPDDNQTSTVFLLSDLVPEQGVNIRSGAAPGFGRISENAITELGNFRLGSNTVQPWNGNVTGPMNFSLQDLDIMIHNLSRMRSDMSSYAANFKSSIDFLEEQKMSYTSYQSRVNDTDFASTSSQLVKSQIQNKMASSMLTQANSQGSLVLSLLP